VKQKRKEEEAKHMRQRYKEEMRECDKCEKQTRKEHGSATRWGTKILPK
jgi:hypothetical protein